jgi:NADPH2:quinone reductase
MKAIVMNRPGRSEVLEIVDWPEPIPGPGEALVEIAATGVNFMDTGVRRGVLAQVLIESFHDAGLPLPVVP